MSAYTLEYREPKPRSGLLDFLLSSIAAALLVGAVFVGLSTLHTYLTTPPYTSESYVRVYTDLGHGSGVHIGNGIIISAEHVVSGRSEMSIETTNGEQFTATVLHADAARDVVILKISGPATGLRSTELACRPVVVGEEITAAGNPGPMRNVKSWGRVSAKAAQHGRWASGAIADITVGAGMSGGPLYARDGVIGIVVGVYTAHPGFLIFVPSQVLCGLVMAEGAK
jgi:S1-C subfamily serine protease